MRTVFVFASLALLVVYSDDQLDDATRVFRIQVNYLNASTSDIEANPKWNSLLKSSFLASLRFINKHWLICGGTKEEKENPADCGKAHVTGEVIEEGHYRVNVTFMAERDPVRNVKVTANSTVLGVIQIGLKGGIFQYTNALKVLGKPEMDLHSEYSFFCYKGYTLVEDKCKSLHKRH